MSNCVCSVFVKLTALSIFLAAVAAAGCGGGGGSPAGTTGGTTSFAGDTGTTGGTTSSEGMAGTTGGSITTSEDTSAAGATTSSGGETDATGGSISTAGGATGTGGATATTSGASDGSYYNSGVWDGYVWTVASPAGSTIDPTNFSAKAPGFPFCAAGTVAGESDYSGVGMIGFNINQAQGQNTPAENWQPTTVEVGGVVVNVSNPGNSPLRLQLGGPNGDTDANDRWCATITAFDQAVLIPWAAFNTACWDHSGSTYAGQPIQNVDVLVPGATVAGAYSFCVNSIAPVTDSTCSVTCPAGQNLDQSTCTCIGGCSKVCPSGLTLDQSTCTCSCKTTCSGSAYLVLEPGTCQCRCVLAGCPAGKFLVGCSCS